MRVRGNPYLFVCRYCGRTWDTKNRSRRADPAYDGKSNVTGFVAAASDAHEAFCKDRTPAERRKVNATDEARWFRSPPRASRIRNDPTHPGLLPC